MKKYLHFIIISLFLSLSVFVHAQSPFSKVFYDSLQNGIQANAIVKTLDNGYLIVGYSSYYEGLILKIDSNGNLLWNKKIVYTENEIFNCVVATNDSGFILAGSTYDTTHKLTEALIVKVNSKGDAIWSRVILQNGYNNIVLKVYQTFDTGYILTGYSANLNFKSAGIFTAKITAKGILQWTNVVKLSTNYSYGLSVRQSPDSGYIIIGNDGNNAPFEENAVLMKLNSLGEVSWAKKYNLTPSIDTYGNDLKITSDGYLCFLKIQNATTLMKTDFSGNILWYKSALQPFGNSCSYCSSPKFYETHDKGFVFACGSQFGGGSILKMDSAGNYLWTQYLSLGTFDVLETNDNGLLVLGNGPLMYLTKNSTYSPQIGIIKTDSLGNSTSCVFPISTFTTSYALSDSTISFTSLKGGTSSPIFPSVASILLIADSGCVSSTGGIHDINSNNGLSIYPNPSKGNFTLSSLKTIIRGAVEIYNLIGEKIFEQNIINESKMVINLQNVQSGIYIVKVVDGMKQSIQKLIVQ